MMSLWDALRMNMMISYQELVRTFPSKICQARLTFFVFFTTDFLNERHHSFSSWYPLQGV